MPTLGGLKGHFKKTHFQHDEARLRHDLVPRNADEFPPAI